MHVHGFCPDVGDYSSYIIYPNLVLWPVMGKVRSCTMKRTKASGVTIFRYQRLMMIQI